MHVHQRQKDLKARLNYEEGRQSMRISASTPTFSASTPSLSAATPRLCVWIGGLLAHTSVVRGTWSHPPRNCTDSK